jgi:hypothetical protein
MMRGRGELNRSPNPIPSSDSPNQFGENKARKRKADH